MVGVVGWTQLYAYNKSVIARRSGLDSGTCGLTVRRSTDRAIDEILGKFFFEIAAPAIWSPELGSN